MYDTKYPLPAGEKSDWWYIYALIIENYYWSKV